MGRLIDEQTAYDVLTDYYHHTTGTQHQALKEALGRVESVDAVPVVHGRWECDGHHIRCDKCGMLMCNTDREGDAIPRNFCSNCGAKMDGGDGNGTD